ncbi:hypothetical protein HK101_004397, partial [Irineochytrium annulatum]
VVYLNNNGAPPALATAGAPIVLSACDPANDQVALYTGQATSTEKREAGQDVPQHHLCLQHIPDEHERDFAEVASIATFFTVFGARFDAVPLTLGGLPSDVLTKAKLPRALLLGKGPPAWRRHPVSQRGQPPEEVLGISRPGTPGETVPAHAGPPTSNQVPFVNEYPDGVSSRGQHEWPDVRANDVDTAMDPTALDNMKQVTWMLPSILTALGGANPERLGEEAHLELVKQYDATALNKKLHGLVQDARTAMGAGTASFFKATDTGETAPKTPVETLAASGANPDTVGETRIATETPATTIPAAQKHAGETTTAPENAIETAAASDTAAPDTARIPVRLHFPDHNEYRQKPVLMKLVAMIESADPSWTQQPFESRLVGISAAKGAMRDQMMAGKGRKVLVERGEELKEGQTLVDVGVEAVNEISRQPRPRENAVDVVCLICGWTGRRVPTVEIQHRQFPFGRCFTKPRIGWHYVLKREVSNEIYPQDNVYIRWLSSEVDTLVIGGPGKTLDKREVTESLKEFVVSQPTFPGSRPLFASLNDNNSRPMEALYQVFQTLLKRAADTVPSVILPGNPRLRKVKYTASEAAASVGTGHHVAQSDMTWKMDLRR